MDVGVGAERHDQEPEALIIQAAGALPRRGTDGSAAGASRALGSGHGQPDEPLKIIVVPKIKPGSMDFRSKVAADIEIDGRQTMPVSITLGPILLSLSFFLPPRRRELKTGLRGSVREKYRPCERQPLGPW